MNPWRKALLFGVALVFILGVAPPTAWGMVTADDAQKAVKSCGKCHKDYIEKWLPTKHGQVFTKNPQNELQASGCDACHGDGLRHINDAKAKSDPGSAPVDLNLIVTFSKDGGLTPAEERAICITCHFGTENMGHWRGSVHESADLSCLDCHQRKLAAAPVKLERQTRRLPEQVQVSTEVCANCHVQKRASMMRTSHMPVREGKMTCVDCHAAHGGKGPANLIQGSVNENCYSCHAEKRGPLLWEHPPVRENCGNCHDPHGSNYESMLKLKQPYLCQTCHNANYHPSTLYTGSGLPMNAVAAKQQIYRGCANCHPQVHGSNHPSGPRFTR
ncbi:MAG: DmsE family decaheme c-type cytochrome [Nitrospinota bacterium]|nr:DmsE family decaheme c-type cytochrome [Nitrospinota bacterium]